MMHVIDHTTLRQQCSDGRRRVAVADRRLGVNGFEVWVEKIAPSVQASLQSSQGAARAILVVYGHGLLVIDGSVQHFSAPRRLLAPAGRKCEILNAGQEAMQLVIAFSTL